MLSIGKEKAYLEVSDEILRVLPKRPGIDGPPPSLQQQQLVKRLEDVDARLVNGTNHGTPRVNSVANGPHHNCSSTGVQT